MHLPLALRVAAPSARMHSRRLGGAVGLVLVRVGLVLLRPWPLALAVDHALDESRSSTVIPVLGSVTPLQVLVLAGAAGVLLSVLLGVLDLLLERCAEGAAERIGATMRATMFDTVMSRSLRWHDRMRSGELVSRLTSDVGRLLDAVVSATTSLLPDLVMLVAVLLLIGRIDPELTLIGLSVVPVLAVLAVRQRRRVQVAQREARAASGQLVTTVSDLLRNIRAVQAFGRGDRAASMFGSRNQSLLDVELRAIDVEARWAPVADVVLAVGTALVLAVGGAHVLAGTLSIGGLLVVLAYLRDLYGPVRGLTRLSTVLAKASASAARVRELLDCDEAVVDHPHACPAPPLAFGLRFERVTFGYEPGRPVVRDLSFEARAGETLCLLGPSGTGKSTILNLILRLYDVDGGRVLIDEIDVRACDQRSLRERFTFMPQDPWLLDTTLAENIAFGSGTATRTDVLAAGRRASVDEFVDGLPDGYETMLGEGAVRLSGGQRRRVALARAAVSPAPVLLLDEPTASLDPASADAVIRAIRTATADRTAVIVTHDPQLAFLADRVITLGSPSPAGSPDLTTQQRDRKEVSTR